MQSDTDGRKGRSRRGLGSILDSIVIPKHLARATGNPQAKDIWWKIFDSHQNGPALPPELLHHWLGTILTKHDLDRNALVNQERKPGGHESNMLPGAGKCVTHL